MTNRRAVATQERPGLFSVSFENPETAAMSAICDLLQALPDDAARRRVMHWAFGRFAPEFKRPVAETTTPEAVPSAQVVAFTPVAEADQPVAAAPPQADMGDQISELGDLFPGRVKPNADDLDVRGL